jgi:hypothetical protein
VKNLSSDDSSKNELNHLDVPPMVNDSSPVSSDVQEGSDSAAAEEPQDPQTKVCRKCSVQTQTVGDYCPNCGTAYAAKRLFAKGTSALLLSSQSSSLP